MQNLVLARDAQRSVDSRYSHCCWDVQRRIPVLAGISHGTLFVSAGGGFDFPVACSEPLLGLEWTFPGLLMAATSGDLWLFDFQDKPQLVGCIDGGLQALSVSPDYELVALVSRSSKLLIISLATFDVVHEGVLASDASVPQPVSLGWGSTETQFRGQGARSASRQPQSAPIEQADHGCHLSWRSDSQYLAISVCIEGFQRLLVVSRNGAVQSATAGIGALCAWRPLDASGGSGVIATFLEGGLRFWERNGLLKNLHQLDLDVDELQWNADASILAVRSGSTCILMEQLNYHWYRKGVFHLPEMREMRWSPEDPLALLMLGRGCYRAVSLRRKFFIAPDDSCTVYVVNGDKLLATPLATHCIPPPLSLYEIELPAAGSVRDMCAEDPASCAYGPIDHTRSIARDQEPSPHKQKSVTWLLMDSALFQLRDRGLQFFCQLSTGLSPISLIPLPSTVLLTEEESSAAIGILAVRQGHELVLTHPTTGRVLLPIPEDCVYFGPGLLYQRENRTLGALWDDTLSIQLPFIAEECAWLTSDVLVAYSRYAACLALYRLSSKTEITMISGISSYSLRPSAWLSVCQVDGTLIFINAAEPESSLKRQNWEKGAVLVALIPQTGSCVLLTRRGNLETVLGRPLLAETIKGLLRNACYGEAFRLARKHRLELCQIAMFFGGVDLFASRVPQIVEQVPADQLAQFALGLVGKEAPQFCSALLDGLMRCGTLKNFREPLIACHVRCDTLPALLLLFPKLGDVAQCVRYLRCLIPSPQRIFQEALGTFDLELAESVAAACELDPAEYRSLFQHLSTLSPALQRFKICERLQRTWDAVCCLLQVTESEQSADATLPSLLQLASRDWDSVGERLVEDCVVRGHKETAEVSRAFAVHLDGQKRFSAAADYFAIAKDYTAASACLQKDRKRSDWWHASIALCPQSAQAVLELLVKDRDFDGAFSVASVFIGDPSLALNCLVDGERWTAGQAFLQNSRHPSEVFEVLSEHFARAVETSCLQYAERLQEAQTLHTRRCDRLRQVRDRVSQPPPQPEMALIDDALSQSAASTFIRAHMSTTSTHASNRSRRNGQKIRLRSKEGGLFEEDWLMHQVQTIATQVLASREAFSQFSRLLVVRGDAPRAFQLGELWKQVSTQINESLDWVFDESLAISNDLKRELGDSYVRPWSRPEPISNIFPS